MAEKFLFENFGDDKRIYNLNQGYWKRKLQSRLRQKFSNENVFFNNIDSRGEKIYDANPIFTFINSEKTKAIRIIQDDIKQLKEDKQYSENELMDAWIDEAIINQSTESSFYEPNKIQELVIALFLTRGTVEKTMELIIQWINSDRLNSEQIELILNK